MKLTKRMKIAGVVAVVVLAITIIAMAGFVAFMGYIGSDALSDQATGSELIRPDGTAAGKALVVYNPGLSGAAKSAAAQIANDLKSRGYEVTFAGVKSESAANASGYDVIVAGGPIYGGKVSPSIESYLRALDPPDNAMVGAFAIGNNIIDKPFPDAVRLNVTAVMSPEEGMDSQTADFVARLLK